MKDLIGGGFFGDPAGDQSGGNEISVGWKILGGFKFLGVRWRFRGYFRFRFRT